MARNGNFAITPEISNQAGFVRINQKVIANPQKSTIPIDKNPLDSESHQGQASNLAKAGRKTNRAKRCATIKRILSQIRKPAASFERQQRQIHAICEA
jgi:hypothetical protein